MDTNNILCLLLAVLITNRSPAATSPNAVELENTIAAAAAYQPGQSLAPFRAIEDWVRRAVANPSARTDIEAGLVRLLEPASSFEARRFACIQLGIIGSQTALPALTRLLYNPETTGIACLALTTFPSGKADQALRSALGSVTGNSRKQIIETLGDRRDAKSIALLAALVHNPDNSAADAAMAALGKIGTRGAWETLVALRRDPEGAASAGLIEALINCANHFTAAGDRKLAHPVLTDLLGNSHPSFIRRAAFSTLIRLDKDRGQARIVETLNHSDPVLTPVAIALVRDLPSKTASRQFGALLSQLPPEEQVWMVQSLAARADASAHEAIAKSLRTSTHSEVRSAAITALNRLGGTSDVTLLAHAAGEASEPEEIKAIESALVELGGGPQTDQAIRLELERASGITRTRLLTAIATREGAGANEILFNETHNTDPQVTKTAFRALAKTAGGPDANRLLSSLNESLSPEACAEAEVAAEAALAKIRNASQRSTTVREAFSQAKSPESKVSLFNLLPVCADAQALALAKATLQDTDVKVHAAALGALADWPDLSAWDPLIEVYRNAAKETDRALALRGLARLAAEISPQTDSERVGRYMQLLAAARGDADLKLILGGLGGVATPEALQLALPLLSNPGVKAEAEVAVRKIAVSIQGQHPQAASAALHRLEKQ